ARARPRPPARHGAEGACGGAHRCGGGGGRCLRRSGRSKDRMKHAIRHIHFVGIGGAGMSGVAEVLLHQGYRIAGSDLGESASTKRLAALGAEVFKGHDAKHIEGADAIVTSTAVKPDNPEVVAAHAKLVPVVPRAVMLAELMRLKKGVAIA